MSVSDAVSACPQAAYDMAFAGVRQRFPGASPREQFLRVALIVLGRDLACRAFPDAVELVVS